MITSVQMVSLFLQEQVPMTPQTFVCISTILGALGCGGLCGIISGCPAFLLGYLCCGWCCCCYIVPCSGALGGGILGGLWGILNAICGGLIGGLGSLVLSIGCYLSPWSTVYCGNAGAYAGAYADACLPQICPVS
jgi:hypothetical protein